MLVILLKYTVIGANVFQQGPPVRCASVVGMNTNLPDAATRLHDVPVSDPVPPTQPPAPPPPMPDPEDPASPAIPVREPPSQQPPMRMLG